MSYRLKPNQSFDAGVRRVGVEQIDRALHHLQGGDGDGDPIHETRKALKRIRALLRLVRPGLSSHDYRTENARYRDIGRLLAGARDSQVLLETVVMFEAMSAGRTKSAFAAARSRLAGKAAAGEAGDRDEAIALAIEGLVAGRAIMAEISFKDAAFDVAIEGMARTYRQAARAFEDAYETPDGEALHEWRKYVQHHWRQMSLLTAAWPEMAQARVAAAKDISNMLGEDHDIEVMLAALDAKSGKARVASQSGKRSLTEGQQKLAHACAVERQAELRAACHTLGLRLFAEPADAFANRMRHYWASADPAHDLPAER
ncbi:MAG: CHAD domain-containing protein [Hyphomicrobiaceae bacterium]